MGSWEIDSGIGLDNEDAMMAAVEEQNINRGFVGEEMERVRRPCKPRM